MIHLFRDCNLYIFIILLVLNFSDVLPEYIRYYGFMIALFIFAMSICKNYVIQNPLIKKCSIGVSYPFIFAILYSTLLLIIGENNLMYWASGSLMCFRMFCLIFMGYAIIAKYKWQSVDFLFLSCSIAYLVLTLQGVIQYGPLYVLNMAFNISEERFEWSQEGSDFNQIFEVHEFGLAMPLLALYYLLSSKQWKCLLLFYLLISLRLCHIIIM